NDLLSPRRESCYDTQASREKQCHCQTMHNGTSPQITPDSRQPILRSFAGPSSPGLAYGFLSPSVNRRSLWSLPNPSCVYPLGAFKSLFTRSVPSAPFGIASRGARISEIWFFVNSFFWRDSQFCECHGRKGVLPHMQRRHIRDIGGVSTIVLPYLRVCEFG